MKAECNRATVLSERAQWAKAEKKSQGWIKNKISEQAHHQADRTKKVSKGINKLATKVAMKMALPAKTV